MNNGSICGELVMTFSLEHLSLGTTSSSHEICSNVKSENSTGIAWVRGKGDTCFTGSTIEGERKGERKRKEEGEGRGKGTGKERRKGKEKGKGKRKGKWQRVKGRGQRERERRLALNTDILTVISL